MGPHFGDLQNPQTDLRAREVALGQKTVIHAVLRNIIVVGAIIVVPEMSLSKQAGSLLVLTSWMLRLITLVMGIYGIIKISSGLEWSGAAKVCTFILLLIPLINLITLFVVNGKATSFLKGAGYKVGLAGAYK